MKELTVKELAAYFDHTQLKAYAQKEDFEKLCREADEYGFAMVAINSSPVACCKELLKDSKVHVGAAISFPLGQTTIETKVFETKDAVAKGAVEVDMVMNIGRFLSGEYDYVENEIAEVAAAAHEGGALLKVIFENYYLTEDQIVKACQLAKNAGADFIKSSTVYAGGGAVLSDMQVMVDHAQGMKVKAAGGIRTLDDCLALMSIGVVRCGTRASEKILGEAKEREEAGTLYLTI